MKQSKRAVCVVALILAAACSGLAQVQPEAMDVLQNVAAAYHGMTTFQAEGTTLIEMNGPNMQNKMEIPMKLTIATPNRMRIESKAATMDMLVISDGKTMWMYMPQLNMYSKMDLNGASGSSASATQQFHKSFGQYEAIARHVKSAKIVRSEALTLDGSKVDCDVVEVEREPAAGQAAPGSMATSQIQSAVSDLWVAKDRFLVLRDRSDIKMTLPGASAPTETLSTTTFNSIKVNDPVPDSLFSFTPPAGARKMDLSQFMPGAPPVKK